MRAGKLKKISFLLMRDVKSRIPSLFFAVTLLLQSTFSIFLRRNLFQRHFFYKKKCKKMSLIYTFYQLTYYIRYFKF